MKVVDLFCGAGGLSLGLERAGFEPILGVDNDSTFLETYNENLETKVWERDMRNVLSVPNCDVVAGGPPCQGFSFAAGYHGRSPDDERNDLVFHFWRLVRDVEAEGFIMENVPGIKDMDMPEGNGKVLRELKRRFEKLGYKVNVMDLYAPNYGVPQTRERVFIVGAKKDRPKTPSPTHAQKEQKTLDGDTLKAYEPCINALEGVDEDLPNHDLIEHTEVAKESIRKVRNGEEVSKYEALNPNKPSPTIVTFNVYYVHPREDRALTVREMARLQTFPDWFKFFGNKEEQVDQVGNAVPPLLAERVGESLMEALS